MALWVVVGVGGGGAAGSEEEGGLTLSDSTTSLGRSGAGSGGLRVATSIANCVLLGKTALVNLRGKSGSLEQVRWGLLLLLLLLCRILSLPPLSVAAPPACRGARAPLRAVFGSRWGGGFRTCVYVHATPCPLLAVPMSVRPRPRLRPCPCPRAGEQGPP